MFNRACEALLDAPGSEILEIVHVAINDHGEFIAKALDLNEDYLEELNEKLWNRALRKGQDA